LSGYSILATLFATHSISAWFVVATVSILLLVIWIVILRPRRPSKLTIHSANYRAWKQGGKTFEVAEFLRKIIGGDSLVLGPIENHNFTIDGKNYVPDDPYAYEPKRLQVKYSYDGEEARTVERGEHGRLVLPEDSEIDALKKERDTFRDAAASATEFNRRLEEKLAEVSVQTPKIDALADALKQIAVTDAKKMSERVPEISQRLEFHFGQGAEPSLDVITELLNASVFDLVNFGEISGHTTYAGRQLAADPRIIVPVEPPVLSLKHGEKLSFTVRQYLSAEMADVMQANRGRGVAIDFGNVMVKFKVLPRLGFSMERFIWSGPKFTIEDIRRV
jgi:hypothetical protein